MTRVTICPCHAGGIIRQTFIKNFFPTQKRKAEDPPHLPSHLAIPAYYGVGLGFEKICYFKVVYALSELKKL